MLSSVEKQMFLPNIINATDPKISILLTSVLPIVNLKSRQYNKQEFFSLLLHYSTPRKNKQTNKQRKNVKN